MNNSKHDLYTASGLALVFFGLYLSFLSQAYVFEGLIRAMPIETGRWGHLFPGNYLLFGPLGLVCHTLLQAVGAPHLAVISLQRMDAALGAAGLFVFYFTLRRLGGDRWESLVGSAVLGGSLGYFLWSTEAEDYILSSCLLLLTFYFLVKSTRASVDPVVLGALHGLAILGHIVNVLFGPVILWFLIRRYGSGSLKPVRRYVCAAGLVAGAAYGSVLLFLRKPSTFRDALVWFAGSANAPNASLNIGGGVSAHKVWEWLRMSVHILGSFGTEYANPPEWAVSRPLLWIAWGLLALFAAVFIVRFRSVYKGEPVVVGGCLIWLAMYALMFTRWEPYTMVYRVSDLVPICTLFFLAYRTLRHRRLALFGASGLAACLVMGNLGAEIYPRSFESNNPHLARMAFLKSNTAVNSWITGDSGKDEIYIPYFAERRPIVIARYDRDPAALASKLDGLLADGQSVYVTSRVLEAAFWKAFFRRYRLVPTARDPGGFALYQIRHYHAKR